MSLYRHWGAKLVSVPEPGSGPEHMMESTRKKPLMAEH